MTDVHASLGSRRRKQRPHKALRSTALDPYCTDAVSPQVPLVRSSAEYQPSHIQPEESPRPTQPAPVPALTPTPETAVDVVRPDTKNQTEKYSSALVKEVPPTHEDKAPQAPDVSSLGRSCAKPVVQNSEFSVRSDFQSRLTQAWSLSAGKASGVANSLVKRVKVKRIGNATQNIRTAATQNVNMPALIAGMSFLLILFAAFYSSQDEQALQSTAIGPRTADQKHTADNPVRVTTAESSRNGSVGVDAIDNEIPNDRQDLISAKQIDIDQLELKNAGLQLEVQRLNSEALTREQQLLDLELALEELRLKERDNTEKKTVYNFVNVPIDAASGAYTSTGSPAMVDQFISTPTGQSSSLQATQAETLDIDEDLALQDIPLEDFDAAYEAFISEEDSLSESEDWEQIVIESRQGQSSQDNGLYDDDVELIFDGQTGIYSYPPEK